MFEVCNTLTITDYDIQKPVGERIEVDPNIGLCTFSNTEDLLLFHDQPQAQAILRDLLNNKPIIERNNVIHVTSDDFNSSSIFPTDMEKLSHRMFFGENPLIKFKEKYGQLEFKIEVLPKTILCRRDYYSDRLVTFATKITLLTKVPLLTLEQLQKPFRFGHRLSIQQAMAARAIMEYGDKVSSIHWNEDNSSEGRALVNREYHEKHPMGAFIRKIFGDTPPTAAKIINSLDILFGEGRFDFDQSDDFLDPTFTFFEAESLTFDFRFKCTSLNRFLRDLHDMLRAMQKGVREIQNANEIDMVTFRKFTSQCHGLVRFKCKGGNNTRALTVFNDYIYILQQAITITEQKILPLEKELGPEFDKAKPFRRMTAAIATYIFNKVALDPITYADYSNTDKSLRNYARTLID